ncbi:hypothetical protein CEUSTIGMA_g8807.t1 [Chlamydomonas eustigma]|uniref:adenylate kinase n=1 Tax=Chlamydomonas eustigma TaxID=1157962 RepID=A0A250XE88_9CHLO|nr:hypothetical protein CEUSTIGMA_g8807.t1 [Chlamydomonas eustigma]|eukprot:GAX81376.1 hypothetical protein CEUSTIGMA_g8807.t1 [Chlamydomonas eustigma]
MQQMKVGRQENKGRLAQQRSKAPMSRRKTVAVNASQLRVMISGAPAAGKGTQCANIVEKYNLVHISVGDLLRDEVKNASPAGKRAKDFMDRGELVPDEVVVDMVKTRLAQGDVQRSGWLLDGYPRSASQAEAIEKEGIRPDVFLLVNVPDELLIERVVGRRMDPVTGNIYHLKFKPPPHDVVDRLIQRSDDTEDKCKVRLDTYHKNVDAVIGYYKNLMVEIDGNQSMEKVFANISQVIDAVKAGKDPLEAFCQQVPEADECRVYE